jgi:hypothetical protein
MLIINKAHLYNQPFLPSVRTPDFDSATQTYKKLKGESKMTKNILTRITLGSHKNVRAIRAALENIHVRVSAWANDILNRIPISNDEVGVEAFIVSLSSLGLKSKTRYSQICTRAQGQGFQICPAEVGPLLRLSYTDQPRGEILPIIMEPVAISGGQLQIFNLAHDSDGLNLRTELGNPQEKWHGNPLFVLARFG